MAFRMLESTVITSKAWLGSKVAVLAYTPIYPYTLHPPYHIHYTHIPNTHTTPIPYILYSTPILYIPYTHIHYTTTPISYISYLILTPRTSPIFSGGAYTGRGRHEAVPPQHGQVAPLPQPAALGVGERGGGTKTHHLYLYINPHMYTYTTILTHICTHIPLILTHTYILTHILSHLLTHTQTY
jgi:hypothetical protein